ncbi:hypothetical protein MKX01_000179 [Papaver californicum]|nr:hypothetical protein MKX01_000179 [Papaver californicum]
MGRVAESSPAHKRKRDHPPKLSEDERKVYDLIISTEDMGIWTRDIKFKVKVLPDTVVNKSIKSLKDKGLIKEVVNIQNKGKKTLMGSDFEPSVDLTGGAWYAEGKLDTALIEVVKSQCLKFISRSKVATVGEITEFINNVGIFTVKFTGQQIEELVQSLVLDKMIVEAKSTGKGDFAKIPPGEQCYRCANKRGLLPKTGALASIPCGVCPRLNECTPDGIISPSTCVYFKKWLDF